MLLTSNHCFSKKPVFINLYMVPSRGITLWLPLHSRFVICWLTWHPVIHASPPFLYPLRLSWTDLWPIVNSTLPHSELAWGYVKFRFCCWIDIQSIDKDRVVCTERTVKPTIIEHNWESSCVVLVGKLNYFLLDIKLDVFVEFETVGFCIPSKEDPGNLHRIEWYWWENENIRLKFALMMESWQQSDHDNWGLLRRCRLKR